MPFMLYSRKKSRVPHSGITGTFCGHTELAMDDGGAEDGPGLAPLCPQNSWNLGEQAALTPSTKTISPSQNNLLKCEVTYGALLISSSRDTSGQCGFLLTPLLPALLPLGSRLCSLDITHTFGNQAILC